MKRKSIVSVKMECYGLSAIYYVSYDTGEVKKFYSLRSLPVTVRRFLENASTVSDSWVNGSLITVYEGVSA